MHYLNSSYTTYFNLKRKRSGHLFQGRFKAILVEVENYLLELSRYLHLNPVRAGIVKLPEQYPYSSYPAYVFSDRQDIVTRNLIWGMMGKDARRAPKLYREFIESGLRQRKGTLGETQIISRVLGNRYLLLHQRPAPQRGNPQSL